jgi:hypothetical protein
MSAREMALAYAAVEGKDWRRAGEHADRALQGGHRAALQLLAVIRYQEGNFAAALSLLEEARHAGELTADGAARLIRLHLLAGDPRCGWQLLLDCCRHSVFGPALYSLPRWSGEPLEGRRIVVWGGGYGDEMLFVRYIPALAATGAIVYLNCRPALVELFSTLDGVHQVLPFDVEVRDAEFQLNTAELPVHFGAPDGHVWPASGPYLRAKPISLSTGRRRVGLVWAADSRHLEADDRSASLADLMPLAHVPEVELFSLQVGRHAGQASPPPAGMSIADLSPGFPTFAEQASQLMALDLVVTVDTAVANLAGALGAKVWVAVPSVPDWRWTLDGALTPWYPTARVYRQSRPGGWRDVFRTMAADLSASLAGRGTI